MLENQSSYRKIDSDFVNACKEKFFEPVVGAYNQGTVTKKLWEFVRAANPIIPTFYSLPKIHEDPTNPPGHPIVSERGSLTVSLPTCLWLNILH